MAKETEINFRTYDNPQSEPGAPEVGAIPEDADSHPANGSSEPAPENPPTYAGNGAG